MSAVRTRYLDGPLEQTRGVIGRYPAPGERYVFRFDRPAPRLVHMVGVRRPLRVVWKAYGEAVAERVLSPWVGWGYHRADTIVEARP